MRQRRERPRAAFVRVLPALVCLAAAPAGAQDGKAIDAQRFQELARTCQATAATPPSPAALRIGEVARARHASFRGSRIDNAGRMIFFGSTEAESDRESDSQVSPQQVPWHQVWRFWEELYGGKSGLSPHAALEVWFYPGITNDAPATQLPRRRVRLETLLRAIDRVDFSSFGEEAAAVKAALQQSAIRASVSDVAWSAAFVSAVMRQAGLSSSAFHYTPINIHFIGAAIRQSWSELEGQAQEHFFRACDPVLTHPRVGDMYCFHRHGEGTPGTYKAKPGMSLFQSLVADLRSDPYAVSRSHCDIVVRVDDAAKKVFVVGGNVQNSVSERMLNLNRKGVLSANQGPTRCANNPDKSAREEPNCNLNAQPWFVLLQARR